MYFQDILQGIASNLMDSNLFQLKSSTFHETYRWVPVTWEFLLTYFQASVRLLFLGIPDRQLNVGHWSFGFSLSNMDNFGRMMLYSNTQNARQIIEL